MTMSVRRAVVLVTVAHALAATDAGSQTRDSAGAPPSAGTPASRTAKARGAWCLRRRPDCRYLFLLDAGYFRRLGGTATTELSRDAWGYPVRPNAVADHASVEYGVLFRPAAVASRGVAMHVAVDSYGSRYGVRARYRRWVNPDAALEIAAGPFWASQDVADAEGPGVSADVRLGMSEYAAVVVRQNVSHASGRMAHASFAGLTVGGGALAHPAGRAALGVAALAALVAAVVAIKDLERISF